MKPLYAVLVFSLLFLAGLAVCALLLSDHATLSDARLAMIVGGQAQGEPACCTNCHPITDTIVECLHVNGDPTPTCSRTMCIVSKLNENACSRGGNNQDCSTSEIDPNNPWAKQWVYDNVNCNSDEQWVVLDIWMYTVAGKNCAECSPWRVACRNGITQANCEKGTAVPGYSPKDRPGRRTCN